MILITKCFVDLWLINTNAPNALLMAVEQNVFLRKVKFCLLLAYIITLKNYFEGNNIEILHFGLKNHSSYGLSVAKRKNK